MAWEYFAIWKLDDYAIATVAVSLLQGLQGLFGFGSKVSVDSSFRIGEFSSQLKLISL